MRPDILHVVSYSEASHAARPEEIIESCNIVDQVIDQVYSSKLNVIDDRVTQRKEDLIKQARWIIDLIPSLTKSTDEIQNPYINLEALTRLVKHGIFDAPHLKNNKYAQGKIKTKIIDGACISWDDQLQKPIDEIERILQILSKISHEFPQLKQVRKKIAKMELME